MDAFSTLPYSVSPQWVILHRCPPYPAWAPTSHANLPFLWMSSAYCLGFETPLWSVQMLFSSNFPFTWLSSLICPDNDTPQESAPLGRCLSQPGCALTSFSGSSRLPLTFSINDSIIMPSLTTLEWHCLGKEEKENGNGQLFALKFAPNLGFCLQCWLTLVNLPAHWILPGHHDFLLIPAVVCLAVSVPSKHVPGLNSSSTTSPSHL